MKWKIDKQMQDDFNNNKIIINYKESKHPDKLKILRILYSKGSCGNYQCYIKLVGFDYTSLDYVRKTYDIDSIMLIEDMLEADKLTYGGEIKDFPPEVVEKMLEQQEIQTGRRDVTVFEKCNVACLTKAGFSWGTAAWPNEDQDEFWYDVITGRNFDLFFEVYNKDLNKTIKKEVKYAENDNESGYEIPRKTISVSKGERRPGSAISGRRCGASVEVGHLSYRKITV